MAKLLITTQIWENYAWVDGELQTGVNAYWKAKGGSDYVVRKFRGSHADATLVVMALRSQIETDNDAFREQIIDFRVVADNYLTDFEQSQLDYEGKITYSPKELVW